MLGKLGMRGGRGVLFGVVWGFVFGSILCR